MTILEPRTLKGGATRWAPPRGTHFITIDLEVYSRVRLTPLVEAFGESMIALFEGRVRSRYLAAFELGESWQLSADQELRRYIALIRKLPPAARRLWRGAQSRTFDIGIRAGTTPRLFALSLSPGTIAAVADLRGRITVTTYAPERPARRATRAQLRAGPKQ